MKFFTPIIFVVFAASAVMARSIAKEVDEKASTTETATVMGISEAEVRQKQAGCDVGICHPFYCPQNC
ncbi:uncharacterized protein BYT42DRAFT_612414 [Radiomyces spectabilis]|uniref:uncharacterized protein n=1 Tax=Radiomyces spectabilis TaxID=64574 RepID=UPI00222008F1|nr:uncharacterized protein BYT42DRAFT_612414 [Radiomyces spectabilis]KAI8384735.1 hypothetical protein BYT42DRAFT_612414 [Radiomyces spectabilis]